MLGRSEDARHYAELLRALKRAFVRAYVGEDGRLAGDTQCAYVLALAFDLLEGDHEAAARRHLVRTIEDRDWHLSTGFVGTKELMLVLSRIGRTDVAYRLLHNDTFPSWGFSIKNGATTIWERWNGWTPENGYFDPGMNSFAHYSFGAVGQWIFETVGGISPEEPGYRRILIAPHPGGRLRSAATRYDSVRGGIETRWILWRDGLQLEVKIPPNTRATLRMPARDPPQVTEGGRPAAEAEGVRLLRVEPGAVIFELVSGHYRFDSFYTVSDPSLPPRGR